MEKRLSCHRVSQLVVKITAVFVLATLVHTIVVLNRRGLLFSNYRLGALKEQPSSEVREQPVEDDDYDTVDELREEQRITSQDQLQSIEEEEREKEDAAIDQEHDSGQDTFLQDSIAAESFSPKRTYSSLGEREISTVKRFVFFVGYSRSGHSIVASLLDAHPNIIIAHEYNLFRRWKGNTYKNRSFLYNELYRNSYNNAEKGWRSSAKDQKGYTLSVKDSWQGSFEELLVIGEKSGAVTAQTYDNDPLLFLQMLKELRDTVRVPIRVIHVVRNPYDMISTRLLYIDGKSKKFKVQASVDRKHVNPYTLSQQVNRTIHVVQSVNELLHNCNLTTLEVHLADLVLRPDHVINNLCMFIGVECPRDYLQKCSEKVYGSSSQTRQIVEWPQRLVDKVYEMIIKPYQPFWRYSYSSS